MLNVPLHILIFLVGWAYYLVLPFFVLDLGHRFEFELFPSVTEFFNFESAWYWALPLISTAMLLFFLGGSGLGSLLCSPSKCIKLKYSFSQFFLPAYLIIIVYLALKSRSQLFSGYAHGVDTEVAGAFSTMQMLLVFHYLVCGCIGNTIYKKAAFYLLIINSVILIGLGGRLYVVTAVISVVVFEFYRKSRLHRWSSSKFISFALLTSGVLIGLGMWRVADFSLSNLIFYGGAESFFTYISAATYIQSGEWNLLNTPVDFFSGFVNLIPTAILPEKQNIMVSLIDSSGSIQSPYGAINIVASTVANFGLIGAMIFFFVVGMFFEKLRKGIKCKLSLVCYCYLCGLLPFMFFRDPFQIQVKVVLTGLILVGIYYLLQVIASLLRPQIRANRAASL